MTTDKRASHTPLEDELRAKAWQSSRRGRSAYEHVCYRAADTITELLEALEKCRDKFRHYEDLHRVKCTAEGDEKADRNREMADLCDGAIAKARGEA